MSSELKTAAQQAVDAFDAFGDADDFASLFELTQKMRALRTAIQQAEAQQPDNTACKSVQKRLEAQQPATDEPVYQIRKAFTQDAEWAWRDATEAVFHMHPEDHRRILYTHPVPIVPADVVRDEIASVREHYRGTDCGKAAECVCDAIDAAMLAAKDASA